ncbi:MAG: FkbM family methyltransferase [Sphaerochaetaceae bacterium]|nr:FkbM family methyltransferase [Sphaerochaetaceae bacterium]
MEDFWSLIKKTTRPIVLYGTGNAAEKLLDLLTERGVRVSGCMASDGFVRDRSFRNYKVLSFERAKQIFGPEMVVVLGFGSHDVKVIENIKNVAKECELYAPDILTDEEGNVFDIQYYEKHLKEIEWAKSLLCDEESRRVFEREIQYRLSARIEHLIECESSDEENWKLLNIGPDEAFMDLGAYNGDTIRRFLSFSRTYEHIYAVEPERRNFRRLEAYAFELENCTLFNVGISDRREEKSFAQGKGRGSNANREGSDLLFDSIDNLLSGRRVSILKFDIEGQEPKGLLGAKYTINRYRPKMVLSAYHRIDDFWALPRIIMNIRDDYKFYMRHSPCIPAWEYDYFIV